MRAQADSRQRALEEAYAARVAELEKAATTARRGARVERDIDDARLWLLVETLADAATGVRRELGLSAPSVRPGDTVGGTLAGDGRARNAVDTVALDRLLALPHVHRGERPTYHPARLEVTEGRQHADRDAQFRYLAAQVAESIAARSGGGDGRARERGRDGDQRNRHQERQDEQTTE